MADLMAVIASVLVRRYGVDAVVIQHQEGGQDDAATVFRVHAPSGSYSAGAPTGGLHVVDRDVVTRAPRERDLMFFIGGISEDWMPNRGSDWFRAGYGDAPIDSEAISYYRHAWAVQDVSSYTLRVLDQGRGVAGAIEAADIRRAFFARVRSWS